MDQRKIIIPGGTGFIGDYVARYFSSRGFDVIVLSRVRSDICGGIRYVNWDAKTIGEWAGLVDGAYAVLNFTGRSVDCRLTPRNRNEILASRQDSVQVLMNACLLATTPPSVFIQASSIGYYGHTKALCTEKSMAGTGFFADVCAQLEDVFFDAELPSVRKIVLRIGIVLGRNKGAMKRLVLLARNYLGGRLGNGRQHVSWIHIDDLTRMIEFSLNNAKVEGIYNATGIHPVTNRVFMATLRIALRKPWSPPIPGFMVRIGAFTVMRSNAGLVLQGAGCVPKRFLAQGFVFKYTRLLQALRNLLNQ